MIDVLIMSVYNPPMLYVIHLFVLGKYMQVAAVNAMGFGLYSPPSNVTGTLEKTGVEEGGYVIVLRGAGGRGLGKALGYDHI